MAELTPTTKAKLTFVSDVIDYKKDIEPYRVIQVVAGVGAGKNCWVSTFSSEYRTLYITSRQATASAEAKENGWVRFISMGCIVLNSDYSEFDSFGIMCTNQGIEKYIKEQYNPDDEKTHLWNYIDIIVLDEAHSLANDATFTRAPFHVERFILTAMKKNPKLKLILMTGTPKPVKWLTDAFEKEGLKSESYFNRIDLFKKTHHVIPKEVQLITRDEAKWLLQQYVADGQKAIYFVSSVKHENELRNTLLEQGIAAEEIGIGFSDEKKFDEFPAHEIDTIKKQREEIVTSLTKKKILPENIRVFLTTSRNKEGINIRNEDIKVLFCESRSHSDLTQMAGRVRCGVDHLYVVYDGLRCENIDDVVLQEQIAFSALAFITEDGVKINLLNQWLESFLRKKKDKKETFIRTIEEKFPEVGYDYFNQTFIKYEGRQHGLRRQIEDYNTMEDCLKYWKEEAVSTDGIRDFDKKHRDGLVDFFTGEEMIGYWFPESKILAPIYPLTTDTLRVMIEQFLIENSYIGVPIENSRAAGICDEINRLPRMAEVLSKLRRKTFSNLGLAVRAGGYQKKPHGTKRGKHQKFIITKISKDKGTTDSSGES